MGGGLTIFGADNRFGKHFGDQQADRGPKQRISGILLMGRGIPMAGDLRAEEADWEVEGKRNPWSRK